MITFDLSLHDASVARVSTNDRAADLGPWARLSEAFQRGILGGTDSELEVSLNVLLAELEVVREVTRTFGATVAFGDSFRARITKLGRDRRAREAAVVGPVPEAADIQEVLGQLGF